MTCFFLLEVPVLRDILQDLLGGVSVSSECDLLARHVVAVLSREECHYVSESLRSAAMGKTLPTSYTTL